jgi:hypothetical protein
MFPKGFLLTAVTAIFLATTTTLIIFWARGYRPDFQEKTLKGTGLLVINSSPTGAQVYLNERLTTATNNTLNLIPGDYQVKIVKDGYLPWEKTLKLQKELVTQANALLLPVAPSLEALTFTGVVKAIPSPDGQKIAFTTASASAEAKNGLYILRLSGGPFSFRPETQQIGSQLGFDFLDADFLWSPNSSQILAYRQNESGEIFQAVLLEADRLNNLPYPDQTGVLPLLLGDWQQEVTEVTTANLAKLPEKLKAILETNADGLYWSPNKEKILYTATASAALPDELLPPLPASNTQSQNRKLEPGKIYVYDLKEDKNFAVGEFNRDKIPPLPEKQPLLAQIKRLSNSYSPVFSQPFQWYSDSQHLLISQENKILIEEYDHTNQTTVYTGPLKNLVDNFAFVFPWPDGSKLVILTSLNKDQPVNLYGIKIK